VRIAYITAGAAGMYCGSCLHDNALASALLRLGHDVTLVPTYTPIRTDETDVSADRVFYGAINVYLEDRFALFRWLPRGLDRWLAGRRLLDQVSRFAVSVDAAQLGRMTHSVLLGENGPQRKELERLLDWLRAEIRPEVVHITNSMLIGLAGPLRRELRVPVLCSLQGEDIFIDGLAEPWRERVMAALRAQAHHVDAFVATSRYYAEHMAGWLGLPAARIQVVPLGLPLEGHGSGSGPATDRPFVVGYLARLCPEKGLHILAGAFRRLAAERGRDAVRLRVAGFVAARDRPFVEQVRRGLEGDGLGGVVEILGEIDRETKLRFLDTLHVLSVPTVYREPKGRFVLEALANAVPVVAPAHGAFPELVEATGGGLLVEPGSEPALAAALGRLMDDPARRQLGRRGQAVVRREFGADTEAARTLAVYDRLLGERGQPAIAPAAAR
jgi:glycosyltransferase involved in cell wall biosynthesis